ncbi:MAG: hypothetical protein J6S67_12330 [Methanobrevibacter sp.]|nr:hypothetical protein [Methanobrevibacter sp.]
MSDFFMSNQDENEVQSAEQFRTNIQNNQQEDIEAFKQKKQERLENWNRYGVDVPDEYYKVFNQIISKAPTPEEAQEEAYKIGSAVKYSRMMGISIEEAYKNVDSLNEAMFTDMQGQKGRYEALSDMWNLGTNNVKLGRLGQQLMAAHRQNDTELANKLMAEIDAINKQNVLMQDNAPRTWVMEALEAGAQSLPFTGVVAGAGVIGNFIAPAAGTGAAFVASSYLASGQEYIDMIANGASPETARIVSTVSGGIQGLIEADLGISKGIVKGTARLIGKEAAEKAAKKSLEEVGRKVFKRFHFGAGKKLLVNYLENYGKNVLGEGTEEFLQEITSIVGQEVAASLDGYDIPDDDLNSIVKQTTEAFRGGVLGALSMGFIPAGINGAADIKQYKALRENAESYESPEMFKDAVKDSPIFEGMSDTAKSNVINEVWKRAQNRKEEYVNAEAKRIAEVQDAAEGAAELKTEDENEGEEAEATPVVRDEEGKLYTQDGVRTDDEGNATGGTFVVGNRNEESGNRYGYINWEFADGDQSKIIINDFKMAKGREGIRAEVFNDFAIQHPGVDIQWNTKGSEAAAIKDLLSESNPSGKKNGLNYYADENAVADAATRQRVAAEYKKNIHKINKTISKDGSVQYKRDQVSNEEASAAVALLEAAAKRNGVSLTQYVNDTFGNNIFGSMDEFAESAAAQGDSTRGKAGGMGWKQYGQQVKAVIYAGENADFSTWSHELAHIFQAQLTGDLKTQAETAFNVVNGDWINSKYTFKDGSVMPAAEAFAYGFQDWLKTGKTENEQMKNIFQKFAEFIARAYNSLKDFINLTPEITSVYEQLLKGDDSLMKAAEMAVEAEDRRYRAQMQSQTKQAEETRKAEEEQQKKKEEAEREEASELTDFTEEEKELTPEEAENKLDEVTADDTEKETDAIDDALENTNLTDDQKTEIADVLKDESTTVVEKAEAMTDAASSVYDDIDNDSIPDELFFQLAGEASIQRMAEGEERKRILADLDAAQLMDKKYKNMDDASKAARIRRATGWEKDATGRWKFELDDSINRIKLGTKIAQAIKDAPELLSDASTANLLNLGDILDAPELYKVFPYMKNVRVSFYSDPNAFRAVLTPQGIKVNTRYLQGIDGEKGLKGVLAHEIQHVIQAMEYADSKGLQGENIEQLYNDMMDAMQAAGERKYDYDLTSLQNGLDAYMKDAGEIEARNVARRILMNADARRMNTLASTEDVKRKVLFQNNISDEELKQIFNNQEHTETRQKYIDDYYTSRKNEYEVKSFTSSDGTITANLEVYKNRDFKQTDIDNGLFFANKGIDVTLLPEGEIDNEKNIDALFYHNALVEFKQVTTDKPKNIAQEIKDAANKMNSEIISVFFADKAKNVNYDDVIDAVNFKKGKGDFKGDYDELLFVKDGEVTRLNKNAASPAEANTDRTSNITQPDSEVNKKLDDEYMKAVEAGDMEKVQKMVDQQAVKKGYTTPEDYRDAHAAPAANIEKEDFKDLDKLRELNDESWDVNLYAIAHGIMNVDEDYFVHPNRFGYGDDVSMKSATTINNVIRQIKAGNDDATITVYRAVPTDIKGEQLETSGQWVSPTKEYVENHGLARFGEGNYRIIEQTVPATDLWFDFGDIKEWGYDDGTTKNVYKNVPNNRKLNEPITYDEKGNIIPLSKRFDENNPSILYQIAGEIGAENLDNAEVQEGVSRMQNLAIAKQMDAVGEDAQKIRLATSWEKGSDGKWRYEIDDSKFKTDFLYKSFNFRQQYPRYNELEKKLEENNFDWDKLTKAEQTEFDELGDILNRMYYKEDLVLSDVLDARELYAAYPMLKNVPIKFTETDYKKGYEGQMRHGVALFELDDGTTDKQPYYEIEINSLPNDYNSERIRSTLLHEIQHIIQRIEGFATGGNLDLAGEIIEENNEKKRIKHNKALAWAWRNELIATEKEHPELRGTTKVMDALLEEYKEDNYDIKRLEEEGWIPEEDVRIKGFNLYVRGYDNEGYEDAYNEWSKNIAGYKPELVTDWAKARIYKRFGGEVESRNVQSRMNFTPEQRINTLLSATEDVRPEDKIILFQTVYHGSGADFDKFDTENYGLSGEGSMTFGYGTYLTEDEEIARSYAERQRKTDISGSLAYAVLEQNDFNREAAEKELREFASSGFDAETYQKALNKFLTLSIEELKKETSTNLYTVEIPDIGYLSFDKPVSKEEFEIIAPVYAEEMYNRWLNDSEWQDGFTYTDQQKEGIRKHFEEDMLSLAEDPTYDGEQLYKYIERKLEYYDRENASRLASKLLNKAGFTGIKYPAGTIHGNGNGAYNYVIFNDDDAKIVDKLLFQTQAELADEARSFEDWQSFMEYCEAMHADDEVSPIPYNADAQWYQSFYETAHGVQTEEEKNEDVVTEQVKKEGALPGAVDALFATYVRSNPEMVDNFLKAVADIDAIDLDSEEWQHVEDEEGAKQRERIDQLKDFIDVTLSDYNWQTAIKRVQGGNEIAEGLRKRLIGEMLDNFKIRDFRAIYAEIMDDQQFAVDEADSTVAQLNKKLSKYKKFDILKPNEDISRVSPERRKRIAEALQNREIAEKIRNGSLKLDDEIETYLKSLDKQVKDLQKEYNELEKETQNDYQRLADAERRKLLKLHEELLLAGSKLKTRDAETERKIKKGLKITEKYQKLSQNMTANYDELFRKFTDLKNTMQITAEVQAALDRQDQVAGLKENLNNKQKEKSLIAEVKKMRIQLVKRAMRRVPFNRIDYDNARTVIAIQRMLEPNLLGGVNRFIGIDSAYLRGVISGIVTDSEYKAKILNYLRKQDKSSQAFVDFLKKVENLKSIKDFDSWTAKERKYAIKHLPKENWVRDLNLQQLAKEREESIDLDIGMKEKQVQRIDPKTGRVMEDKEGNPIYETTFVLDAADDLKKLVKDAVGADMFDLITDKPFAEWTTEELERLAQRIDELYTEGRDMFAAKQEARKRENDAIRKRVEDAIKETGITINDDDTPEEKERKAEKIAKILNQKSGLKGTEAGKNSGIKAKFDRLIHGYADANVLRVARILDNYSEGENVRLLYRREDECFNNKTRSIMKRGETVKKVMADNKITEGSLAEVVTVPSLGTEFTVDELLYFLAADKDFEIDEKKAARAGLSPLDMNDDYAATSRNAVMFGNMMSDNASQEQKEAWAKEDRDMQDAIENDTLTTEQKQLLAVGQLDKKPGTTKFINTCKAKWEIVLGTANSFITAHPEYNALLQAIEADYAEQYERMNEISINEFNTPVHRVRAYVPLVRRESNGDTNVNQVKEDLLGAYGADAGKQWVNKGMTQRRQNISPLNQKPVQTGLFRTWGDSIERTEHFIAYAPYVRQLNAVYKSRDASYTRRFIESRYGKPMLDYIDSYINEVANPNAGKIRERGAEFLHVLRGKTAPAYLGWKFSGIVKQGLTSPWPYMQFVNPAEYLAAATKCWTTGGKYYEAIKEKSAYMASRVMDPINELVDEMAENAKGKVDRAWSKFAKTGMQGLEWIDWTCVAPGWLACYEKEYNRLQNMSEARYQEKIAELTEKNMTAEIGTSEWMSRDQIEQAAKQELMDDIETEAVRYADDCTRACQPSSRLTDLAPLFKNSSEAMKAFLQFQTSLNVIWQNLRYDIPYNIRQKEFKKIVGTVCGYVLAGIFMNSVMDGVKGDDDDDDMQTLRNLIYYSTTQFTDAIPVMGSEITNVMDKVITGKRAYSQSGTDMTPSATKLLTALEKVTSGDFKKAASLTAEGIGLYLGAPVSGTKEIYKLLGKPLSEGDVNLARGVGDVYGIAGDIIGE